MYNYFVMERVHELGPFRSCMPCRSINVHAARGTAARHEARNFCPDQAWHGLMVSGPGLARPEGVGRAWAAAHAHELARHGPTFDGRPGSGLASPLPLLTPPPLPMGHGPAQPMRSPPSPACLPASYISGHRARPRRLSASPSRLTPNPSTGAAPSRLTRHPEP